MEGIGSSRGFIIKTFVTTLCRLIIPTWPSYSKSSQQHQQESLDNLVLPVGRIFNRDVRSEGVNLICENPRLIGRVTKRTSRNLVNCRTSCPVARALSILTG